MYQEIFGDLIKQHNEFDVILHGCNCKNTMGSGIARSLRDRWPGVYDADTAASASSTNNLGNVSTYKTPGGVIVVNCYTQFDFTGRRYGKMDADYDAIRSCMKKIKIMFPNSKIGLPLIGCGLAGGDWNVVSKIVQEELSDMDVTVVKWNNVL